MIIFLAGASTGEALRYLIEAKAKHVLSSYYYLEKNKIDLKKFPFKKIFLDSGGYTARIQNKKILVKNYGKFIIKNKKYIHSFANLDLTETKGTIKNQEYLEKIGLKPIPVFHFDEWKAKKFKLFSDYITRHDKIAIGGIAGVPAKFKDLEKFLNFVFRHTKDKIKVHGFGITGSKILKTYPFYSADSTSWLIGAQYAKLFRFKGQKFIIISVGRKIKIEKEKLLKLDNPYQYINVDKTMRKKNSIRCIQNIRAYQEYEKFITRLWKIKGIEWKE